MAAVIVVSVATWCGRLRRTKGTRRKSAAGVRMKRVKRDLGSGSGATAFRLHSGTLQPAAVVHVRQYARTY